MCKERTGATCVPSIGAVGRERERRWAKTGWRGRALAYARCAAQAPRGAWTRDGVAVRRTARAGCGVPARRRELGGERPREEPADLRSPLISV